jgi:hypothetical protein
MNQPVSLNPETFVDVTGLIDDVDVVVESAAFVMFDYGGKAPITPCLKAVLKPEAGDAVDQFWSVGSPTEWQPTPDGKGIIAMGKATGLNRSSNCGLFLTSLINCGFPADKLATDISVLAGLQGHVNRMAVEKKRNVKEGQAKKDDTVLVMTKINKLPWEAAGAPAAAAASPGGAPAATPGNDALKNEVTGFLLAQLGAGPVAKQALPALIFKGFEAHPSRNQIMTMVYDDAFLGAGPWKYENGQLSLG